MSNIHLYGFDDVTLNTLSKYNLLHFSDLNQTDVLSPGRMNEGNYLSIKNGASISYSSTSNTISISFGVRFNDILDFSFFNITVSDTTIKLSITNRILSILNREQAIDTLKKFRMFNNEWFWISTIIQRKNNVCNLTVFANGYEILQSSKINIENYQNNETLFIIGDDNSNNTIDIDDLIIQDNTYSNLSIMKSYKVSLLPIKKIETSANLIGSDNKETILTDLSDNSYISGTGQESLITFDTNKNVSGVRAVEFTYRTRTNNNGVFSLLAKGTQEYWGSFREVDIADATIVSSNNFTTNEVNYLSYYTDFTYYDDFIKYGITAKITT
ncbi:hypothetical protein [Photobacterium damselae]|uniref:hypothetical protein n=1 Tax=Photobacterium damselae TaxID=38293 RepID=UPI002F3FA47E